MITGKKTALALTVALLSACGGGGGATVLNISAVEAYRVADKTVTFAYIESTSPTASTLNMAFSKAIASAPLHDYWSLVDMGGDVFEVQLKQPPKDAVISTSEGAHGLVLPAAETTVPTTIGRTTTTPASSTTVATTPKGTTTTAVGAPTTSVTSSTTVAGSTTTSPATTSPTTAAATEEAVPTTSHGDDHTETPVVGDSGVPSAPEEEVVLLRACITKKEGRWTPANHACESHEGADSPGDSHGDSSGDAHAASGGSTDASHASSDTHWSYTGAEGPNAWGELDESWTTCVDGSAQSPINIAKPVGKDVVNPVVEYVPGSAEILNNGHTIQANATAGSSLMINGSTYALAQAHFHSPSEHTVDGVSAPVEVHFVNKTSDSKLAVLGVMVIQGKENKAWQPLVSALAVKKDAPVTAELDWAAMLPKDKTTFRYDGSLTTPPCSEGVSWMLFKYPVELSAKQIDAFKSAYSGNNRPLQLVGDREVILDTTPTK
jgi:carbonic anhydrase